MVVPRLFLLSAFALPLINAINLSLSGSPQFGQAITLTWDGVGPWALNILTAPDGADAFTLYKHFNPITVNSGVWHVDVDAGTLVEFEVTDSTGSEGSQSILIDDGGLGASTSSIASESSVSVASTQSLASVSSISVLSTLSLGMATSSSPSPTSTPVSTPSPTSKTRPITPFPSPSASHSSNGGQTTDLPSQSSSQKGPKAGAVAGGVIGTLLGIMILATLYWLCRRHQRRALTEGFYAQQGSQEKFGRSGGHRRTLSRGQPHSVDWNPEQPHLTPAGTGGPDYFAPNPPLPREREESPRASSVLRQFGEFITTPSMIPDNSLNLDLAPAPQPQSRPSVLDIARGAQKNDLPLYTPSSLSTNKRRSQADPMLTHAGGHYQAERGDSPFADKFAVSGRYEPDLSDPSLNASLSPPPPRPIRPSAPLDFPSQPTSPPNRNRNSISQVGPVPTVGHQRKISGPIPMVMNPSAPHGAEERAVIPSWAFGNEDSRYPAIMVQAPSTASSVGGGGMAGVGSGGLTRNGSVGQHGQGRQIYPVSAMGPKSPPRRPQQQRSSSNPIQTQTPMGPRSPPTGPRSPPTGPRSPPIQGPRSPPFAPRPSPPKGPRSPPTHPISPTLRAQAMSPPLMSLTPAPAQAMSPPPMQLSPAAQVPPPTGLSPLVPPRKISAEPDVPTTPVSPALSAFPTPPLLHDTPKGSVSTLGSVQIQEAIVKPVLGASPKVALKPIETSLPYASASSSTLATGSGSGSSPIPTPLASSTIASPNTSRFGHGQGSGLNRGDTASSRITASTGHIRRELTNTNDAYGGMAPLPPPVPHTPFTPSFIPSGITNYEAQPGLPASFEPTFQSPIGQALGGEGPWYEGRHISLAPTMMSHQSTAESARRLSDTEAEGDAEWKALEKELKWLNSDEAHVMPRQSQHRAGTR